MEGELKGKRIVLTRAREQANDSTELFTERGAEVIALPCIKVVPIEDYSRFDDIVHNTFFDFIIFPSANSVLMFKNRINHLEDVSFIKNAKVVAVGLKTEEQCKKLDMNVDLVPDIYNARGVLDLLSQYDLNGKSVLLPSSTIARTELGEGLEKLGAKVFTLAVYDIVLPDKEEVRNEINDIRKNRPDLFVFTSPSTFENCTKLFDIKNPKIFFKNINIAAIGTTTQQVIENAGLKVDIIPDSFTMNSLVKKVVEFYQT